jgi:glycosyltransferase involved in cell wall biosynthesis
MEVIVRILIFNWRDITHPWAGGAELNIHEQAKRWVQAGHQVTLFCGAYEGGSQHANIDGVEIVRKGGRFTVYFWAVVNYLLYFHGKYDAIVDCENGIPFFTPLYSRTPQACIAHHVHTKQFRTEFSPPLSWIGIFLESVVMPIVYRQVPFITISQSSRQELATIGINPEKCSVVYCGLNHGLYRPGGAKTQRPSLIYLGRLMRYKRVDMLIRFMGPILKECPDAVLHVVGHGPAGAELAQMVDQCGLAEHVILHGFVSEDDKVHLLQQAWALVIASMNEGWGLVAVEAHACGTPAIAFNVPGLCEAVGCPDAGMLVESEDEFVQAVCRVLQDQDYRDKLTQATIGHAGQFNWDKTAARTLHILARASRRGWKSGIYAGMRRKPAKPVKP